MMILKIIRFTERMWVHIEIPPFPIAILFSCLFILWGLGGMFFLKKIVSKPLNPDIRPAWCRCCWLLRSGCVWGSKKPLGFFKSPFKKMIELPPKTYKSKWFPSTRPPKKRSQIDFVLSGIGGYGLVVWIPGMPLWKGLLLRGTPRIPNHQPKPPINH